MASPILLELGSIIQINSPKNNNLHNNVYYIDYIDDDKIKLTNPEKNEILTLTNGKIDDESIENITILSKPKEKGYAKIEGLTPDTWVELHFGGDVPTIITGKISDIFEDTIELTTFPGEDVIYIDFEYKGLPEELEISKIVKREKPTSEELDKEKQKEETPLKEDIEEIDNNVIEEDLAVIEEDLAVIEELENMDTFLSDEKIKEIIITGDDLKFEGSLDEITQDIDVPDYEKRFDISIQTNDILDEILAKIPTYKRTKKVLNELHSLIERYKQLRTLYSVFDENGNIIRPLIKGSKFKPLVESLKNLSHKVKWILPVGTYQKKIYLDGDDYEAFINGQNDTFENYTDVIPKGPYEDLRRESNLLESFKKNTLPSGEEKLSYLLNNIQVFGTPYENVSSVENTLDNITTNTSMDVVINNYNDFESTTFKNKDVGSNRFTLQNYGVGFKAIRKRAYKNENTVMYNITPNDKVIIESILTLPYNVMKYSVINAPSSNIFTKSLLNKIPFTYSQILKNNTIVTSQTINDLDEKINYNNMTKTIQHTEFSENIENDNKYNNYLQKTIPTNNKLFNLIKDDLTYCVNIESIINHLQPFLIEHNDITYKHFESMNEFLQQNIMKYKTAIATNKNLFEKELFTRFKVEYAYPVLFKNIDESMNDLLKKSYHFQQKQFNVELLKNMLVEDNTWLLTSVYSFINKDLFSVNVESIVDNTLETTQESLFTATDPCKKYVLSKKYIDINELDEDNNKPIYYDKKYDNTDYDIIRSYSKNDMSDEQYKEYVAIKLHENIGLPIEVAREDADTMIIGKKIIKEGDYAVLEGYENDKFTSTYYERKDSKWVIDETVTKDTFITGKKAICDSKEECISYDKDCINANATLNTTSTLLKKMKESLDNDFYKNKKNFSKYIKGVVDNRITRLHAINTMQHNYNNQYDYRKTKIGQTVEIKDIEVSPHQPLLNAILGQPDFVKKQNDIISFFNTYLKEGENTQIYYCIDTDVPLMPVFLLTLAVSFKEGLYVNTLQRIIKNQGKLSESGDYWVDKHTGYFICPINLTQEEEYSSDGFKVITHSVIEQNASEGIFGKQDKYVTKESKYISNVIKTITNYMGIFILSQEDFIMKNVYIDLKKNIPSESDYNKKLEFLKKKKINKKMPTYDYVFNNALLKYTLCYVLITLQTMTPSVKTRKTFPGCVRSFVGYPFYNKTDMSSLKYIACISSKLKSKYEPWNSIIKEKEETLFKSLNGIMDKIITKQEVIDKFAEKDNYLQIYKEYESIPEEYSLTRWTTFLPPLQEIKIDRVNFFTKEFLDSLKENIGKGNKEQDNQLFILNGKIFDYTLTILKSIQEVINKEEVILQTKNNVPFLENACCNIGEKYTLRYFIDKEPSINEHNKRAMELSKLYSEYKLLAKAPVYYDPTNTKLVYPTLSDNFSEETIYRAFIHFCKYNKNIPVPEKLKTVCNSNVSKFSQFDSISKKIETLKREGKNYTQVDFEILIRIIEQQNIVNINLQKTYPSARTVLNEILLFLQSKQGTIVPMSLIEKLLELNDNYDSFVIKDDFEPLIQFRDYILEKSNDYKQQITQYINNHSNKASVKKRNANLFLTNINKWSKLENNETLTVDDLRNEKISNTLIQQIMELAIIIPLKIINDVSELSEVKQNQSVPKHWKLSPTHAKDIQTLIKKKYAYFTEFKSVEPLINLLEKFTEKSYDVLRLVKEFPLQGKISTMSLEETTIFNSLLHREFISYMFLFLCIEMIKLSNDISLEVREIPLREEFSSTNVDNEEENIGAISEIEIVTGERLQLKGYVADLLTSFFEYFTNEKKTVNYNKETILAKVLRSKEKEKDEVTDYFKKMSDQEREIENLFKSNKLGKWSLGLGRGIFEYDQDLYDKERAAIEDRAILEKKVGVLSDVTQSNAEIFMLENELQSISDEFADNEAYDLSMLPEDDNHPEGMDGDEMFY